MRALALLVAGGLAFVWVLDELRAWEASMRRAGVELERRERTIAELWSRIDHCGPQWRREDPEFEGCKW